MKQERRWKVIGDGNGHFNFGDIITLYENDNTVCPFFNLPDMSDYWSCGLSHLVEIDANGDTIRTYKESDTLDGGTLVKKEEKKMEEYKCAKCGEIKELPFRRDEMGGYVCVHCVDHELTYLAAEVQRLRDELEKVIDVWDDVPSNVVGISTYHHFADKDSVMPARYYERTLPQDTDELLAEKHGLDPAAFKAAIAERDKR